MTTEVLFKKGKKGAPSYFRAECTADSSNPKLLNDFLIDLLDPSKPIDDWDTIDWCRWVMAGGLTPDEYAQTVSRYDNATTCGLVWTVNFVAYRCRTCGISQCMSLCAECFQQGNHEGHDFNMFRSQAGGACDCGDTSVMKESGFCSRHGPKAQMDKTPAPPDLLCVAEAMMPRIILRLIQHLRDSSINTHQDPCPPAVDEADSYLTFLHQLSEMGAAMRKVITQALTNPLTYQNLTNNCDSEDLKKLAYIHRSNEKYEEAKRKLSNCECPEEYQDIPSLQRELHHNTFLEELMFWTVKYQFPQKLVCFLLNMLPDLDYKVAFAKTFVHHYSRISVMLAQSNDTDTLSNRVVHVSVQLFSNEALVLPLTQNYKLLHVMVISLMATMKRILQFSTLQSSEKNYHRVVNCGHHIMRNHCYWPLVSDLNNILTHRPVALVFLQEPGMLEMWFEFISMFQGMNVNQREMSEHVEYESNTYYAAFSAELEASATPMWTLISHIKDCDTLNLTKEVLRLCMVALQNWFDAITFSPSDQPNPYQVTFHLPLHRYFAVFLGQAIKQGALLSELLPSKEMLQMLMMHPLQIQAVFQEILCGIWVRNGLQIKGQALTYIQCHFCNSMVDADLFILQLCATHLDPDIFVKTIMERFHVWEWLSFRSTRKNSFLQNEHVIPMLEGALNLLATILGIRTNLGLSKEEVTRQEMVSLLCMADRTHSQLMELLPEKCGTTSHSQDFERILAQIAEYRAPNFEAGGQMMQGMYIPKPEIWDKEYDPIHVLLRAVHRRDYQSSIDRYKQYVRQSGKFTKPPGSLWPPFRIPARVHTEFKDPRKILRCKTMHGIIFTVLYRAFYDQDVPDQLVALCVYFLELAVNFRESPPNEQDEDFSEEVPDQNYTYWFPSDDVIQNIYMNIKKVVSAEQNSEEIVEEMDVDDYAATDSNEEYAYQVHTPGTEERLESGEQHHPLPGVSVPLALPPSSTTNEGSGIVAVPPVSQGSQSQSMLMPARRRLSIPTRRLLRRLSAPVPALPTASSSQTEAESTSMAVVPAASGGAIYSQSEQSDPLPLEMSSAPNMLTSRHSAPQITPYQITRILAPTSRVTTDINESILSLLIKLHSKLSGTPDSYKPQKNRIEHGNSVNRQAENRIGDGPYFIGSLLDTLVQVNGECSDLSIQDIRQKIWPKLSTNSESSSTATDVLDREERKRRARERQQKLMEEFRSRQKAFMQKTMVSEPDNVPESPVQEKVKSFLSHSQEYECVICGHNGPSTQERPMGLVILLQATSVLGHCQLGDITKFKLPSESDELVTLQGQTLAAYMRSRLDRLTQHFDSDWHMAVNVGWEGGVHVQSCGHCLHVDCHKAYMQSLMNERQQNVIAEKEYYCPLCRQLANSVLPISPDIGKMASIVRSHPGDLTAVATELLELFSSHNSAIPLYFETVENVVQDLTSTTYHQYSRLSNHPNNYTYIFLSSVARINLEVELIQRATNVFTSISKRSCFAPLFHMLSLHSKCSLMVPFVQLWSQLTGLCSEENCSSLTPLEREVPILLRDPSALLLNLILSLPLNIDKAYYTSVVQVLYNLAFLQAIVKCTCLFSHQQRSYWKSCVFVPNSSDTMHLEMLIGLVVDHLEHSCLYLQDDDMDPMQREKEWKVEELEERIRDSCLPYLKIAALLQHHLYDEEFPGLRSDSKAEFFSLSGFLGLMPPCSQNSECSTAVCLKWATAEPPVLIRTLCQDFINFVSKSVIAARNLLEWPLSWHLPRLLELPSNYVQIFQHFHRRVCSTCQNIPKDPSVCLVCGTMVCMRENCCRDKNLSEAVGHSITCGSGTAIFLAVNSCTIIVIRGKRACLWGSIYLDSFGEEDRDLKRGKPLYLSQDRYKLLQQQWLAHTFDHINKRWILHKGNL